MVVHNWRSYKDAKKFVHSLNLKSKNEWAEYTKSKNKPKDIPTAARTVYKKDEMWESWGDWLGTGTIATYNIQYRSFGEARKLSAFILTAGIIILSSSKPTGAMWIRKFTMSFIVSTV